MKTNKIDCGISAVSSTRHPGVISNTKQANCSRLLLWLFPCLLGFVGCGRNGTESTTQSNSGIKNGTEQRAKTNHDLETERTAERPSDADIVTGLSRLAELKEKGIIDAAEFSRLKTHLINSTFPATTDLAIDQSKGTARISGAQTLAFWNQSKQAGASMKIKSAGLDAQFKRLFDAGRIEESGRVLSTMSELMLQRVYTLENLSRETVDPLAIAYIDRQIKDTKRQSEVFATTGGALINYRNDGSFDSLARLSDILKAWEVKNEYDEALSKERGVLRQQTREYLSKQFSMEFPEL